MTDFKLVNIVDSQLNDIESEITLPVITGSSSNNFQTFNAQAGIGNCQIQFNVQVPSLSTAVSRHFLVQTQLDIQVDIAGGVTEGYWEPDEVLFSYGKSNSLQAFPLNALLSTIQSNLNNANFSVNTRDVMAGLLKMYNYEELARYNSLSPSLIDSFYQDYRDGLGSNNNVLANYSTGSYAKEYQPRGVFPVVLLDLQGNVLPSLEIRADDAGTSPLASFIVRFKTTEPLLFLSPYISGNSNNHSAFLGINNLTLTMNLGDASRVMSNASYALRKDTTENPVKTIANVSLKQYAGASLMLNFLTIPPTLFAKMEAKNVVNYNQYTSYNYTPGMTLPKPNGGTMSSVQYSFNNIQLSQIPSKILIYAKPSQSTTYDSNYFSVIEKISINFANKSGTLSSAHQSQLYDMSVKNGLQMSYYEFSGQGVSNSTDGVPEVVPTIGSILVIDPAIDLSIDAQYSNMSTGQYSMQFDITLANQTRADYTPTIYMVVVNSGLFITENGVSRFVTGLLTQEMVLDTKMKTAVIDKHTYEREIVGGSIENLGSIHKHLKTRFSNATEKENMLDNEPGISAGAVSAGAVSAGSMSAGDVPKRRIHKYAK